LRVPCKHQYGSFLHCRNFTGRTKTVKQSFVKVVKNETRHTAAYTRPSNSFNIKKELDIKHPCWIGSIGPRANWISVKEIVTERGRGNGKLAFKLPLPLSVTNQSLFFEFTSHEMAFLYQMFTRPKRTE
jgi:hypothetical protein